MPPHEIICRIENLLRRLAEWNSENAGQAFGAAAESLRRDAHRCLVELESAATRRAPSSSGASEEMDRCERPVSAGEDAGRPGRSGQAMLDSLSDQAALLDGEGNIIAVNAGWLRFARENGGFPDGGLGRRCVDVCREACRLSHDDAREVLEGLSAVLAGERSAYSLDYACHTLDQRRWFQLRAAPLRGARGALATRRQLSDDRHTEMVFELLRRAMDRQDEERQRLSRELHDGPCQTMSAVLIGLRVLDYAATLAEAQEQIANLRRLSSAGAADMRRLSQSLQGSVLDDLGLHAALQQYAGECVHAHGLAVEVDPAGANFGRLPGRLELALFWIAQEAIRNAVRWAGARKVRVGLSRRPDRAELVVADDGKSFEPEGTGTTPGPGLSALREWAGLLGGEITIRSCPEEGTTFIVAVPLRRSENAQN